MPLKQLKKPPPWLDHPLGWGSLSLAGLAGTSKEEFSLSPPAPERPWPSLVLPPEEEDRFLHVMGTEHPQ